MGLGPGAYQYLLPGRRGDKVKPAWMSMDRCEVEDMEVDASMKVFPFRFRSLGLCGVFLLLVCWMGCGGGAGTSVGVPAGAGSASAAVVRGTVVDASNGAQVYGASVELVGDGVSLVACSSWDGAFSFHDVPAGTYSLIAGAPGYETRSTALTVGGVETLARTISLEPVQGEGGVCGVVLSRASSGAALPLTGAVVSVEACALRTSADGAGVFRFDGLPAGRVVVEASEYGFSSRQVLVDVFPGTLTSVELVLDDIRGTLAGTVRSASTSAPLTSVWVGVDGASPSTWTSADGSYVLTGVEEGVVQVRFRLPSYDELDVTTSVFAAAVTTLDVRLTSSWGSLSGTVTDPDGNAVAGARVSVPAQELTTTTNASGLYSFPRVETGYFVAVSVSADGYALGGGSVTVPAGGAAVLDFVLYPDEGDIYGRVLDDAAGTPVSGAVVRIPALSLTRYTDGAGVFRFSSLAPGFHGVMVSATGYTEAETSVPVVAGSTTTVEIRMAPAPNTGAVWGYVTDVVAGRAVGGAVVSYYYDASHSTTSLANGFYRLEDLPAGTVPLLFSASYYSDRIVNATVTAGCETRLDVKLSPSTGTLRGTVQDEYGSPLEGALVGLGGGTRTTTTAADGGYLFEHVTPGGWTVSASATGYVTQSYAVSVNAGYTTVRNFALPRR